MNNDSTQLYIPRFVEKKLEDSIEKELITMLVGARQVGKSTLLERLKNKVKEDKEPQNTQGGMVFKKRVFFYTLDDLSLRTALKKDITFLEKDIQLALGISLRDVKERVFIFIDEIQKFSPLLDWIKQIYDVNGKYVKFVLTGSSVSGFKEKMVETLAGRVEYVYLYPINYAELLNYRKKVSIGWLLPLLQNIAPTPTNKDAVEQILEQINHKKENEKPLKEQIDELLQQVYLVLRENQREVTAVFWEALFYGGLPRIFQVPLQQRVEIIRNYVSVYLEKEIGFIARNLDLELFGLSLSAFAEQSGDLLNIQKVSKDVGVARPSLYRYLDLLENTFLIKRLYPYLRTSDKSATKSVVMYYLDSGLVNVLSHVDSISDLARDHSALLRASRGLVLNMLLSIFEFLPNPPRVTYWADYNDHRVDFVFDWHNVTFGFIFEPHKMDARKFDTTLSKFVELVKNNQIVLITPRVNLPEEGLAYKVESFSVKNKEVIRVDIPLPVLV